LSDIDTTSDPRVGARLAGRYRLERRIASGGMATVYSARDEVLGRDVAIKLMHPALSHDASFAERFRREAQSAARLNHPNIVTVYDTGETDNDLFIVMELVDGTTLRSLLERFGRFDSPTARHVARGVASALDHAHAKGLVHRDVKPENVLLTPQGDVKVVDFGIAKALGPDAARLTTDRPIGTVAYVAPEQLTMKDVDGRADVYALGAMTYEMLTGRAPFHGDTPSAVAAARLRQPVLSPGISPQIDGAVAKATAARPEDRYETPGEFARSLGDGGAPTFLVETNQLPKPEHMPPLPPASHSEAPVTDILPFKTRLRTHSKKRFRMIGAIAVVLAIAAATAYAIAPKSARVPGLRGQTLAEARAALRRDHLVLGRISHAFDDVAPKGTIVWSSPRAGSGVRRGTTVNLRVSRGAELFEVPTVAGKQLEDARKIMEDAGFTLAEGDKRYSVSIPAGGVISLDPSDDHARRGTAFTALVSNGPPLVTVPSIDGKTTDDARAAIEAAGFTFGSSTDYSDTVAQGRAIRSDPAGGQLAPKGSRITAIVSRGPRPFPMPNLVGMKLDAAKARAGSLGLVVRNEYAVPGSGKPKHQVQGQNPPAGSDVRKGTGIDLYYAT
jgi:eukaryotic-like serine/threonine-protein kinase